MNQLADVQTLYNHFFTAHKDSIDALAKILNSPGIKQEEMLILVSALIRLWDDFDVDVKDLVVGALKKLSQKITLSNIPSGELLQSVFNTPKRRRLFRNIELQAIFPQLIDSTTSKPLPVGYDAAWLHIPKRVDSPQIVDWLKQHTLISNPFGPSDLKNYPFYPGGFARPDQWETFLDAVPLLAYCPTKEDAKALSFLLRAECLPVRKDDEKVHLVESKRHVFPILVSLEQISSGLSPLFILALSAAQAWLDILPLCTDAALDLPMPDQHALFEFLCWSFGSNNRVINLIKRNGLRENKSSRILFRKLSSFESKFPSVYLPQDAILLSWLKIRPPDLNLTYLILPVDEFYLADIPWWSKLFNSSISNLFLDGVVIKVLTSMSQPTLSLNSMDVSWTGGLEERLNRSLDSQFDAAMDPEEKLLMGKAIRFYELFGPGASEEEINEKFISASSNSLARMLMLGHRLLQKHCERESPEKYLSIGELNDILIKA